jgi:hypothetical protein
MQRCGKHISAAMNQHATREEYVFSVGSSPRLYNEDLRQLELELRVSPVLAVGRIMARKELGCEKKTSYCAAGTVKTVMNLLPGKRIVEPVIEHTNVCNSEV